jgi:thiamine-phosphate pyrophosphorylase
VHNKLPKKYYFIETFNKSNIDKLDKNIAIIFRNYSEKIKKSEILNLKNYCKNKGLKFFLSNNVKLSVKLNLDGVYLPSFNKNIRHLNYKLKSNFLIIGSAHNIKEIKIKELQKTSIIFISSIFKKNKNYLGINRFRNISKHSTKKIIALGGISQKNYKLLKLTNCYGFAGISYFKKKAPKKGPFLNF